MLRTLILFVILLNVAFFYWARENSFNREVWSHPRSVVGVDPILLLSESQNSDASAPESEALQTTETIYELMCFSIGPFDDSQSSDDMYEVLFDLGIQAKQKIVNEREPKSYWVYLPKYPSRDKAEETVAFLNDNNVAETYIWLDAPHKHAVSLGLFSRLSTARSKKAEIEALGLKPEMEVRYREFTEFWVDYQHESSATQPKELEEMLRENDRLLILETNCA
ncbi:MAG: hypothetical protein AAF372_04590 [Pseudomonadota bacterium]